VAAPIGSRVLAAAFSLVLRRAPQAQVTLAGLASAAGGLGTPYACDEAGPARVALGSVVVAPRAGWDHGSPGARSRRDWCASA